MRDYSFTCFHTPTAAAWRRVRRLADDKTAVREGLSMLEAEAAAYPARAWIEVGRVGDGGSYVKLGVWRWTEGASSWSSAIAALN